MSDAIDTFREAVRAVLGDAPDTIEPGRLHRFSTNGKRSDQSGWLKLFDDGLGGVFGDFRLGISESWSAVDSRQMTRQQRVELSQHLLRAKGERALAQQEAWRRASDTIRILYRQCRRVLPHDPVDGYLRRRLAVEAVTVPGCIWIHKAMPYIHDGETIGTWPAMVAPIVSADGRMLALHRTYLTPDGRKADLPGPVRKLTPAAGLLMGASIPLADPAGGRLGVAEGIETALAATLTSGVPTIAAYSAGALSAYVWPRTVTRLTIFADADDAGRRASEALAARAAAAHLRSEIVAPEDEGSDWCDAWVARQAPHAERRVSA